MSDDKNMRHRFTVPKGDDVVNEWIETQSNLGFSLRVLIKAFVRQYGMKDATFVEFGKAVGKQGRPRKEDGISYERMNQKILIPVDDNGVTQDVAQDVTEDVMDRPITASVETKPPAETKVKTEPSVPAKPVAAIQDTTDDDDDSNINNVGINTDAVVDENGQVDIDALLSGM